MLEFEVCSGWYDDNSVSLLGHRARRVVWVSSNSLMGTQINKPYCCVISNRGLNQSNEFLDLTGLAS